MTIDLDSLGQVLDTTWGRSSTPMTASMSVKMRIIDNEKIAVTFMTVVNFGSNREMIEVRRQYEAESSKIVKQVISNVKSDYKKLTGSSLNLKEVGEPEYTIELTGTSPYNPNKTSLFKRHSVVEFS